MTPLNCLRMYGDILGLADVVVAVLTRGLWQRRQPSTGRVGRNACATAVVASEALHSYLLFRY